MNAQDFAVLRTIVHRTAAVIDNTRRLAALEPGSLSADALLEELYDLEATVEYMADGLALREAASWAPDQRRTPPPVAPPRIHVETPERFGLTGRPVAEAHCPPPPISGRWNNHGRPRRSA